MSRFFRAKWWVLGALVAVSCGSPSEALLPPDEVAQPKLKEAETLQGQYLGYSYRLFVPQRLENETLPLVLLLHGCLQEASSFATVTGFEEIAASKRFYVLSPQQKITQNANRCWNWFDEENQRRGQGEPAALAALVEDVKKTALIDASKTFVVGFSAGGGMASILGATYPDLFSGLGIHSGLAYKAATSPLLATWAMAQGGANPEFQGDQAYLAMGIHAKAMSVMVIQGDSDFTVRPINADHLVTQWAQTNDWATDGQEDDNVDDVPESEVWEDEGNRRFRRRIYTDKTTRRVWLESLQISEMGHVFSGGLEEAPFIETEGPSAARELVRFFGL